MCTRHLALATPAQGSEGGEVDPAAWKQHLQCGAGQPEKEYCRIDQPPCQEHVINVNQTLMLLLLLLLLLLMMMIIMKVCQMFQTPKTPPVQDPMGTTYNMGPLVHTLRVQYL